MNFSSFKSENVLLFLLTFCFQKALRCRGISIDKLLMKDARPNLLSFQFDEASGVYSFDIDMLFTKKQWSDMKETNRTGPLGSGHRGQGPFNNRFGQGQRGRREAPHDLWPDGVVPYEFKYYDDPGERRTAESAMKTWEEHTCVRFREANSRDFNKVYLQSGSTCKSFVGMSREGPQELFLNQNCRQDESVITHELGHVLGLYHEHARHDRDQFVTINWDAVDDMMRMNFEIFSDVVFPTYDVKYDYKSIMHYSATAFSPNDQYTIIPKDHRFTNVIGNSEHLSFRNIKIINAMYNCGGHCRGSCPGEGFHDARCTCQCPGDKGQPLQPCSRGGTDPDAGGVLPDDWKEEENPDEVDACVDENSRCGEWASASQCGKNYAFMSKYCKKACGICGEKKPVECKDASDQCSKWRSWGECEKNPTYMHSYCKESCGQCPNKNGGGSSPTAAPCQDKDARCGGWRNFCYNPNNAHWMAANCRRTCNQCNNGNGYNDESSYCKDESGACEQWANAGECKNNPEYMLAKCKRSCNACDGDKPPPGYSKPQGDMAAEVCEDQDKGCNGWARAGECGANPSFMLLKCRQSCNHC